MRKWWLLGLVGVLVIGGGLAGWHYSQERRPNVLLLVIDTLRADHLGTYGYERDTSPVMDAFAAENLKFSFAVAPAPWTPNAMASILTGLFTTAHGMNPPNSRQEAQKRGIQLNGNLVTLAEVFKALGYETAAVQSNPWLREHYGFSQGFDHYTYAHRVRAGKIHEHARELLPKLESSDKPFFLYLHYMDPHNPYNPPGEFHTMFQGPLKERQYPERQTKYIGLYDGEIRYLDTEIGRLFEHLKEMDLYEDLVIAIVADHGEQFLEHGNQGHGYQLFKEETHVPLFLKCDDCSGVVDTPVSTIDVFPTLLELAGSPKPKAIQAHSLLTGREQRSKDGILMEIRRKLQQKGFVDEQWRKLIIDYPMDVSPVPPRPTEATQIRLYNSRTDRWEEHPIDDEAAKNQLVERFVELYGKTLDSKVAPAEGEEKGMDEATIEELESLGYL